MNSILSLLTKLNLNPQTPCGDLPAALSIRHVTENSSKCREDSAFVAIKGFKSDGHAFIEDAVSRGAQLLVVTDVPDPCPPGVAVIKVSDTRKAAGPLAQLAAGEPSHHMDVVGVTGTNGKTTTTFIVEKILQDAGRNPGMMGTVVVRWPGHEEVAGETTPSGPAIAENLRLMREAGADSVTFEVSSHAIHQNRVDGIRFRVMALTNVTQDHLDYHATMEEYRAVKMSAFDLLLRENPEGIGAVNVDDETGRRVAEKLSASNRITFSIEAADADLRAENIRHDDDGLAFDLVWRGERVAIKSPLHARFNIYNCLTASAMALGIGVDLSTIAKALADFRGAPGRFELVPGLEGVKVFVDYAHTPDAVVKLLENARALTRNRLICVIGCGGDRDRGKRPLMAAAAAQLSDLFVITNDNPRTEDPQRIIDDILAGVPERMNAIRYTIQPDRRVAIQYAIAEAQEGDVVVIAGKGHEDYQILGTTKYHFDDREEARAAIRVVTARRVQ